MACHNLGLLLEAKEQIDGVDGAVEAFKRCLRNDPNHANARTILDELRQYSESDSD